MGKVKTIKALLSKEFSMVDLGEANLCLGIHIERNGVGTICVNQQHYLKKVVEKFGMKDCKAVATPIESRLQLEKEDSKGTCNHQPYRELIGCLTYASISTRPDLCASTNYFSRFQSCYEDNHYTHAKRILIYIEELT